MGRHKIILLFVGLLVILTLYAGTFSYWWLRSPARTLTLKGGQQIYEVQFTFNWLSYHTEILWRPAFWFMEHVCGYEYVGLIAMYDQSIYIYSK